MIRRRLIAAAFFVGAAVPAGAGQSTIPLAPPDAWSGLPPSPATGKPVIVMPSAAPRHGKAAPCLSPLPCGARLYGTVRRNGAVELRVPAWRW